MEALLRFFSENSTVIFVIGFVAVYFALQLWILPRMGIET